MSGLGSFFSTALTFAAAWVGGPVGWWLMAAAVATNIVGTREDMRRAKSQARQRYNDSLTDRLEMADVTPDQPRSLVLGRARTVEGVRRRWVSGVHSQKLTMVVSFAGHEIDGFEQFYFDDVPLTLDAQGYVLTEPYNKPTTESVVTFVQLDGNGLGTVTLPHAPVPGSVSARWSQGAGDGETGGPLVVEVAGNVVSVSGPAFGQPTAGYVAWQHAFGTPTARIRTWLGAPGQNVGAALAAEYPGQITAADRFAGMAVAVVDLDYDPDVYPQGRPNLSAVLRGARVYDPRLDSTQPGGSGPHRLATPTTWQWSENPALHAYHLARHPAGWAVPAAEINAADVVRAASVCDVPTPFTLRMPDGSTSTVTLPRYRCGLVVKAEGPLRAPMDDIMSTMAGRWGWAGGTLRMRAGSMGPAVFGLQPGWVAQRLGEAGEPDGGPVLRITNGVTREQRVNRVTGKCIHPTERWQALPYPAVQDAVLIAQDGAVFPLEADLAGVNHPAHAQHLATVTIRQSQAALRLEASCNLSAWRCELFDVGTVTLPRLGMAGKTVEVLGWRWHPAQGVQLTLGEITAEMFNPVAELQGLDPAPNSELPSPWDVAAVTGLSVQSGTAALADNSILSRVLVSWTPVAQAGVRAGGRIELQFAEFTAAPLNWQSWEEQGAATSAVVPGLRAGRIYLFRVRAVQGMPRVHGPWSPQVAHVVAAAPVVTTGQLAAGAATEVVEFYDEDGIAYSNMA